MIIVMIIRLSLLFSFLFLLFLFGGADAAWI